MEGTGEEGDLAEEWADGCGNDDSSSLRLSLYCGVVNLCEYAREGGHVRAE